MTKLIFIFFSTVVIQQSWAQPTDSHPLSMGSLKANEAKEDLKGKTRAGVKPFSNESDGGVSVASGNSSTQSYHVNQRNAYQWDNNIGKFEGQYLQTSSNDIESARYWLLGLRFERVLSQKWGLFVGQNVESDIFAGYNRRYNTDIGAKYILLETSDWLWFTEDGYRYTTEYTRTDQVNGSHMGRFYMELQHSWGNTKAQAWVEYLPNFSHQEEYKVNSEISMSTMLTNLLSLKIAYLSKFNQVPTPPSTSQRDTLFTTSLVAIY